jgi:catalase
MAVKLMGVEGSESGTQDWVMVSHDVFFTRNAREFVDFPAVVSDLKFKMRAWLRIAWFFLNPKAGPPRLQGLAALFRSLKPTWNPLAMRYSSQTPYRLGGARLMKYSARPKEARPLGRRLAIWFKALAYFVVSNFGGMKHSHDMLRESLIQRLREGDAAFDFDVQVRPTPADDNERQRVEDDAVARWPEQEFPFVKVAEIRVLKLGEDFDADAMMEFGQHLSFSPWHHVPAHEPVGSINLARKVVYARISDLRHELNRKIPREPLPEETPADYLASIEVPS